MPVQVHGAMTVDGSATGVPVIVAPTSGYLLSMTPANPITRAILTHTSTIAAMTLTIANGTLDGQIVNVFFKSAVTALTCSGGNFLATALPIPTAATAGQGMTFVWSVFALSWLRTA